MSIVIAKRYAGAMGGAITALLMASLTICVYFNSIIKTYALITLCFAAALFVLSSDLGDTAKYMLALFFALGAALVRVTATRLHLVNYEIIEQAIESKAAQVIVLTDADIEKLTDSQPPDSESLPRGLDQNYDQEFEMTHFGQYDKTVHVYLKR